MKTRGGILKNVSSGAKGDYRNNSNQGRSMTDILHNKLEKGVNNFNRSERKILVKTEKYLKKQKDKDVSLV